MTEARRRFEGILDLAEDAIISVDSNQRIALFNQGAVEVFGYVADDVLGHPLDILLPRRFAPVHWRHIEAFARAPEVSRLMGQRREVFGRRKDGSEFPAEASISKLDLNGEVVFTVILRDITERKRVEERIRQDERELREIVEAIPTPILVLAPNGNPLYANKRVLEYTGLTPEAFQAGAFRELVVHPSDVERLRDEREEALARGVSFQLEQRVRRKDGQYRWFIIRYEPLLDDQGHVIRWYGTGTDIDDRKRAEERARNENLALREEIDKTSMFEEIVGASPALRAVLAHVSKVAPTDSTVLIIGETGTGKELVARAIHKISSRSNRAFVKFHCAAIPSGLLESELFGHEKGAFTGAVAQKIGRFELANGGTLLLDEVGDIPLELQPKLLRVLQEQEFERLGSTRTVRADVRLVAATNRDLVQLTAEKQFREDLFFRLNVFPIRLPPLREREGDIPLLVRHYVCKYAQRMNKQIETIPEPAMVQLCHYSWPGNVRELQNFIERAVILTPGKVLQVQTHELPEPITPTTATRLETVVREHILRVLRESRGVIGGRRGAALRLGVKRTTLMSKLRKLGISREEYTPVDREVR